jgi:TatD DNase family protein
LISIGTAVLFDKKLQECVKEIPMQKLFLETDATMEFSIQDVYEKVALLKNVSLQELEQNIFENFLNHFKKWDIGWKEPNY